MKEAMALYIETLKEDNVPIPEALLTAKKIAIGA